LNFRAMCLNTFLAAPFIALIPSMADKVLHGDSGTNAWLTTAQGVGALTVALSLSRLSKRFPHAQALPLTMACTATSLVIYGLAPGTVGAVLALVPLGASYMWALNTFSLIAQTRAPAAVRGRVLAINNMVLGILYPIGATLQGRIADAVGLREVTVTAGLVLGAILIGFAVLDRNKVDVLSRPVEVFLPSTVASERR
jgi:predicted MFS family arabinose efflux permease